MYVCIAAFLWARELVFTTSDTSRAHDFLYLSLSHLIGQYFSRNLRIYVLSHKS